MHLGKDPVLGLECMQAPMLSWVAVYAVLVLGSFEDICLLAAAAAAALVYMLMAL